MTDRTPGTIGAGLHDIYAGPWAAKQGRRFLGVLGLLGDSFAQAMIDAWAATLQRRTGGPAYDALRLLGLEFSIPQLPIETWDKYAARIADPWAIWERAGTGGLIVDQLAAVGFPGATIVTTAERGSDYDFNVVFPEGTHPVTGANTVFGDGSTYGDGSIYGPNGLTRDDIESIQSIVIHFKPCHWRALRAIFETSGGDYSIQIQAAA